MKKLTAFLLVAILALSLTACGGEGTSGENSMTKDEMLQSASEVTVSEMMDAFSDNQASANSTYLNNTFLISGITISSGEIKNDCVLCDHGVIRFKYVLPADELANLSSGPDQKIVGTISDIYTEQETYLGTSTEILYIEVNPAYSVS